MHEKSDRGVDIGYGTAWVANFDTLGIMCYSLSMPAKNGRNVSLTDEQDALVERLVQSGRYASASEVVRDGLRLLQRDEQARLLDKWLIEGLTPEEESSIPVEILNRARETIRAKVREGLDEARRGKFVDGEEFFARWKSRLEAAALSESDDSRVKRRA
jgi:antitoxin ParD1/3/4